MPIMAPPRNTTHMSSLRKPIQRFQRAAFFSSSGKVIPTARTFWRWPRSPAR
jgi:hypothetical protein